MPAQRPSRTLAFGFILMCVGWFCCVGYDAAWTLSNVARAARPRPAPADRADADEGVQVHHCMVKDASEEYIVLGNAFDEELLQQLQNELNDLDLEELVAHYREEASKDEEISRDRSTLGAFLDVRETPWLEDHLLGLFEAVRDQWQMPELDLLEPAQYCVYGPDDHFDWHRDQPEVAPPPARRLSMVLMLSAPEDFSGGQLELNITGIVEPRLSAGDAVIFPSETVEHRVAPVQSGMRQTLVCWAYAAPELT